MLETDIKSQSQPAELAVAERATNGNFYGHHPGEEMAREVTTAICIPPWKNAGASWPAASQTSPTTAKRDIGSINYQLERLR